MTWNPWTSKKSLNSSLQCLMSVSPSKQTFHFSLSVVLHIHTGKHTDTSHITTRQRKRDEFYVHNLRSVTSVTFLALSLSCCTYMFCVFVWTCEALLTVVMTQSLAPLQHSSVLLLTCWPELITVNDSQPPSITCSLSILIQVHR